MSNLYGMLKTNAEKVLKLTLCIKNTDILFDLQIKKHKVPGFKNNCLIFGGVK